MNHSLRSLLSTTCLTAFCVWAVAGSAHANPEDGVVSAGQASITANGKTLNIYQQTKKAVIDWRSFNINSDEITSFHQPDSGSITLNRVHSNGASQINGNLNANGNIVIVNQNGVVFGAGAKVDVHGLVASTADIDNDRFMNDDKLHFNKPGQSGASIVNNGTITAKEAGLVGFVAPNVENNGVITARMGRVHLASGSTATIDFYGDGLMEVEVGDDVQSQMVSNTGSIHADGGVVALTAAAGGNIVNGLINSSGSIRAQSVGQKNGEIIISAAGSNAVAGNISANKGKKQGKSKVTISGSLDASGKQAGETGGKIVVTGDEVVLNSTASVDASGYLGGGAINLGGDYQGNGNTPSALYLVVNDGAVINNRSIYTGNGGRTILWSDGETIFEGDIIASGGSVSGDGGFAEVSGHQGLSYNGFADLSAVNGDFGTLLLDPTDITISNAASTANYSAGTYSGAAATSNLNVGVLQTQLASSNVIVTTASAFTGNGDITVVDPIAWSSGRSLTLTATRDISINAAITASTNNASIAATAGRDLTYNANVTAFGTGLLSGLASRNLTVASGASVSSGATGSVSLRAAGGTVTNTGLLTLNGKMNVGTAGLTILSGVDASLNRANMTLGSSTFSLLGASTGNVSIVGVNDLILNSALTSSGSTTLTAYRDLIVNAALTGSGASSSITATASRDLALNANVTATGTGGLTGLATNNLTVASGAIIKSGATGLMSLRSAGGVATNTGLLTLNGKIEVGTNAVTLLSGLNGTSRSNITLDSTTYSQGATVGIMSITGFNDINLNSAITSSGAFSATAYNNLNFNSNLTLSGGSNITGFSTNNLTVASGATLTSGSTGGVNLRAASGNINNTGILALNGKVITGSSNFGFTLLSGLNGTDRGDLNLNTNTYGQQNNGSHGVAITGFRDVALNTNMSSNSANMLIVAQKNLTVGSAATLKTNSGFTVTLRSAGGNNSNLGLLNFDGIIDLTLNSGLIFSSGVDAFGNRSDITFDDTNFIQQGAYINNFQLAGFRDITLNHNVISNQPVTVVAQRNLTIGSGVTVQTGTTTTLQAAGGNIANIGHFNMNGNIVAGTGTLSMISGVDSSGNRADLTLNSSNYSQSGATVSSVNITGFRDVGINTTVRAASNNINIVAERNLDIGTSAFFQTNNGYSTSLRAAGGNINNVGLLTFNGILNLTINSGISMTSGVDASGNRQDLTFDTSNYLMTGATTNSFSILGFRDVYLNRDITLSSQPINVVAERNLTVGTGVTIQSGPTSAITLNAAGGVVGNTGILTLNGRINAGTGNLTITSGVDGSGNRGDLTLDSTHFTTQGGTVGTTVLSGFRDLNLNTDLTSTSGVYATALRNLTVGNGVIVTAASEMQLRAAGANIDNLGLLNLNGKIKVGTGNLLIASGVDSSGGRSNLTLDSNSYGQGANIGFFSVTGFNDVDFNTNVTSNSVSGISVTAQRNLTIGAGTTIRASSNLNLHAAGGVITNTGLLTLNGAIYAGSGGFALTSGVNGSTRSDLVLDNNSYTQVASVNGINIKGFRDVTIDKDLTSHSSVIITAERNLTVASGATIQSGAASAMTLQSAGGIISNAGQLHLDGAINVGTGALTLLSGKDSLGGRSDFLWNNSHVIQQGATINAVSISGFRDVTLDSSITAPGFITIIAERNLDINSGVVLQNGTSNSMILNAAGGDVNHTGVLTLDGILNVGSTLDYLAGLQLLSGLDGTGNRVDIALNNSNLTFQSGVVGKVGINGFRDITLDRSIHSNATVLANAQRDMIIGSNGSIASTGNTTLVAGRNFINYAGAGAITSSAGRWLVYSTDPEKDVSGNLPYAFRVFSCTYGGSCNLPATGNGFAHSILDYDTIGASIPDTVLKLIQNPLISYASHPASGVSGGNADVEPNGDSMTVSSIDNVDQNLLGLDTKAILIFEPELAKRLNLKNWTF